MRRQEHCKLIERGQQSLSRGSVIVDSPYSSRINGKRQNLLFVHRVSTLFLCDFWASSGGNFDPPNLLETSQMTPHSVPSHSIRCIPA
jgi:hypothetical protein